jgi:Leucine-rich repeat (LRR) protein
MYLSSNLLPSTPLLSHTPCLPLLNVQYLELSSAGLQSLPDSFGHRAPNIRSLNLNFNALKDLTPLLGIVRLNKLLLAGNRITRLRKTCLVLARFKALTKLDIRSNPLSVGFYPPLPHENRVVLRHSSWECGQNGDPELQDPYMLPPGDVEADKKWLKSLDAGTKMRRRVAELLLASENEALKEVNGLVFEAKEVLEKRDEVWEGMVKSGVLKRIEEKAMEGEGEKDGDGVVVGEVNGGDKESEGGKKEDEKKGE